jgi:hypothetical protein
MPTRRSLRSRSRHKTDRSSSFSHLAVMAGLVPGMTDAGPPSARKQSARLSSIDQICAYLPAARNARVMHRHVALISVRGRREGRVSADTHGPRAKKKHAAEPQVQPNNRPSLRDGFNAYTRSPRCTGLVGHRHRRDAGRIVANLIPASGYQDHATSRPPPRRSSCAKAPDATASIATRTPRIVTTRTPLFDEAGCAREDIVRHF